MYRPGRPLLVSRYAALIYFLAAGCAGPAKAAPSAPVKSSPDRADSAHRENNRPTGSGELVDITTLDDSIVLDIRYATSDNFAKVAVYPVARCLLRRAVAERLVRVQKALRERGLGLKIWDCYRPISVQMRFWKLVPDARYVAKPVIRDGVAVAGSKHNRGAAVDLTLVDARGVELEMPTGYDDFGERSHRNSRAASAAARRHSKLLEEAMVAEGFSPLATEWWHFDGPGWRRYPLADTPLSDSRQPSRQ